MGLEDSETDFNVMMVDSRFCSYMIGAIAIFR